MMDTAGIRCDVCARPAVSFARDAKRVGGVEFEEYITLGLKSGCIEHPVVSREVDDTELIYRVFS